MQNMKGGSRKIALLKGVGMILDQNWIESFVNQCVVSDWKTIDNLDMMLRLKNVDFHSLRKQQGKRINKN